MMTLRPFRSACSSLLALSLALLTASGCSKKLSVDELNHLPVSNPDGIRGTLDQTPSDMVLWTDFPSQVQEITVVGGITDTTYYNVYRSGAGAVQGVILDYIQSDGYTVFRGQDMHDSAGVAVGGGFRPLDDFTRTPFRRWADRNYYGLASGTVALEPAQLFAFSDPTPPADSLKTYLGRSVMMGVSSTHSQLTNRGQTRSNGTVSQIVYTGEIQPPDSLFRISWQAVPGAAGYWIHVYSTFLRRKELNASGDEAIRVGLASPIAMGGDRMMARDGFIGYVPAPNTSFKLGSDVPLGGRILLYRVLPALQEVLVRVTAVDAMGRMIAITGRNDAFVSEQGPAFGTDSYREDDGSRLRNFPTHAILVTPKRPPPR